MQKLSLLILLLFSLFKISYSQVGAGKISGKIQSANEGINGATVNVLRAKDSSLVKMAVCDKAGTYEIERIANGQYVLKISAVGYTPFISKPINITTDNSSVIVPTIELAK